MLSLKELAEIGSATLEGDAELLISGVATLGAAGPGEISFFANRRYRAELSSTSAGAVVLAKQDRERYPGNRLVSENPYLSFARISAALNPERLPAVGIHSAASVDSSAVVGEGVSIDAGAVVGAEAVIGSGTVIGAAVTIAPGVVVGRDCRILPRVVLLENTRMGDRCRIESGAVLGSKGFGYANDDGTWIPVPQLGGVILHDDVDVGANTTIDRGALEDTVLGRGVKLDNQIQIAHGVVIGEDTAIAACVGISGSTVIGRRCTVAGGVGFVGHLHIADDVHITGMSMVTRSITRPGVYSGYPAYENAQWRKNTARVQKLDEFARRLVMIEKEIDSSNQRGEAIE